ncbi:tripartite tricarboxylate transporter substrate binding protein [Pusillimonas sp. MFBS29]|uniref:Bug family tripartite tricarboxylate transporter substrate binding protein n=1 Tax=Pusillimonas sp. MFBS29 TaxID=2886690 RepID=UPI001D12F03B|nr:tripartite tricarboxylate transporter substrate binding protein [Pusillimonas sp. MFBS29]MCC2595890.1 tripartite tricarboxylate transporter substrate binding protein [Pusillimonas sp. MFBS29]
MDRRNFIISSAAVAAGFARPSLAALTTFPSQTITMYCPFTAGGATDAIMRLIANSMAKTLDTPVIIANKPGAGGTLTATTIRNAKPDGYTLTQVPIGMVRMPHMQAKPTYDFTEDFTFICNVTGYTLGLIVPANSPFHSVQDVVDYAKKNPGALNYASTGVAASPNLLFANFAQLADVDVNHIPYKGDADMLVAVLGEHVDVGTGTATFAPHVDAGKVRLLATYGEKRSERWPDVPTLKELGYDIVSESPWGIAGPKGMDPETVQVLADAIETSLKEQRVLDALGEYVKPVLYIPPKEYATWVQELYKSEEELINRLGLANTL